MKRIKGEYGYLKKKKWRQLLKVLLCAVNIVVLVVLGILITKSNKNLLTVMAILCCLPLANFAATLITVLPYRSGDEEKHRAFLKASKGLLTSYDMVMTDRELILPAQFGVLHEEGVFLYLGERAKLSQVSEAEAFVTRMLLANRQDTHVHIFREWQPFLRRVSSLERAEGAPSEKLKLQKEVLLAISI